jgi:HEAT repeat protein
MATSTTKKRTRPTENLEPLEFEEILSELELGGEQLSGAGLEALSNLNPAEISRLELAWTGVEPARRRVIAARLVEAAEADFSLDFGAVFRNRLQDEDAAVRRKAIEGLWESEDPALIGPLLERLVRDDSEDVQTAAAIVLGRFTLLAELQKLRPEYATELLDTLMSVFYDSDRTVAVRRRALEAVAPLSRPEVTEAINKAYRNTNIKMRASAVYAMGKNCSIAWLPHLLQELNSNEEELRYEAAGACGELGEEEAVPYLIERTADSDGDVHRMAIQSLGQIGGKEAKQHLKTCLEHPDEAVREAAEGALAELEAADDPLSLRRMI